MIASVLRLAQSGVPDAEIAAATGVPKATVSQYRRGRLPRRSLAPPVELCPTCGALKHQFGDLPAGPYAYLLGVYLGDGCLAIYRRQRRLDIALDLDYPNLIDEVAVAISRVRGRLPGRIMRPGGADYVRLYSYWRQWPCHFPQHGPGKKHSRKIELSEWQQALVDEAPGQFPRGLIHTDGWRGVNKVRSKGRDYAYPRYQFSNRSDDIRRLFTDTCDRLGIEWRQWTRWHISVARREAVARLDEFVGPKT